MEQSGKGGKPFKKYKNNRNTNKESHPVNSKVGSVGSDIKNAAPGSAREEYGVSDELIKMTPVQKKKRLADYSGSYGIIESFEAEENKQKEKNQKEKNSRSAKKRTPGNKKNNKSISVKENADTSASSYEKNLPDKQRLAESGKENRNIPTQKGKSGKGKNVRKHTGNFDDSAIKTKANREYFPVDYSDDDIIPDEAFSFDFARKSDSNGRTAEKIRKDSAMPGAVVGRNSVRELLRSERSVDKLYVKNGSREGSIVVIVAEAVSRGIPIVEVSQDKLDSLSGGANHQGVVALAAEKQYTSIDEILKTAKERGEMPLVVIADGIEDPQNLGALIRCAECAGAHGIIIPKRRAVGLTPAVTKASAGAIEHMAIAKVSNLADAIEKLKKAGLWIFAAEAGGTPYYDVDFKVPAAIVFGSEGFGVGRLIKEKSDFTVSIPMYGHVNSLNVATAASVILCHAARLHHS